jgi:hypothetical protein
MAIIKSVYRNGSKNMPTPSGPETVTVYTEVALAAVEVANGNVVQLFELPAGCVPVGYKINTDAMAAAVTVDFGILNAAGTAISIAADDGGDEWLDNSTALQTASLTLHTASRSTFDVLASVRKTASNRVVAIVFASAPTTPAAGGIGVEFSYCEA